MKRLPALIILLSASLFSASQPAHATSCTTAEFRTTHVDLTYCENHGRWKTKDLLYHKGLISLLGSYIEATGLDEKFGSRRVKVTIYSPAFGADFVFGVNRDASTLRIQGRGVLEPMLFLRTLHYFTVPGWQPFPGDRSGAYDGVSDDTILKEFNAILDATVGEIDRVPSQRFVVMNLGHLQVVYDHGALSYELDGVTLAETVQDPIPIRIGDRFLLGSDRGILVYESNKLIAERVWHREDFLPPYFSWASDDGAFVDFYHDLGLALIYSYQTNTFHEIDLDESRGWPAGRVSALCEMKNRHVCIIKSLKRIGFVSWVD